MNPDTTTRYYDDTQVRRYELITINYPAASWKGVLFSIKFSIKFELMLVLGIVILFLIKRYVLH